MILKKKSPLCVCWGAGCVCVWNLAGFIFAWVYFTIKAKNKATQVSVQVNKLVLSSPIKSYTNLYIFPGSSIYLSNLQKFQSHQILLIYTSTSNA